MDDLDDDGETAGNALCVAAAVFLADGSGRHSAGMAGAAPRRRPPAQLAAGPFLLAALTEDDWSVELALSAVPDVVAWTYVPAGLDEATARARLHRQLARTAGGSVQRYVVRDADGAVLGWCGLGALREPEPEVFYALLPRGRGRGAATASVLALVGCAGELGYPSVALMTIDGNVASERVAQRAGFTRGEEVAGEQHGRPVVLRRWTRPTSPTA